MKKLYIVEGLPCSGKSTTSAFIAEELKKKCNVCYVDEGTGNHPADYEFHAFLNNAALQKFNEAEQSSIKLKAEKNVTDILFRSPHSAEIYSINYCHSRFMIFCRGKLNIPFCLKNGTALQTVQMTIKCIFSTVYCCKILCVKL